MALQLTADQATVINNVENNIQNALANGVIDSAASPNSVVLPMQSYSTIDSSLLSTVKAPFKSTLAAFLASLEAVTVVSSFSNSWVNLGTTNYSVGFYKNQLGEVKLRGAISSGTVGSTAFVLPAGYRPSKTMVFAVISNSTIGAVQIDNSGNVTPISPSSNVSVFLDGINFLADQ
ncbi:MAG: hypothetical protein KGO96_07735 [Elusimicrobia bacterium]|nr:hypothetical protein [Elusimicrobiota bacterium]